MTSFVGVLSNNLKAEIAWIILWLKLELHQEHGPQGLHPKKRIKVFNLSKKKNWICFFYMYLLKPIIDGLLLSESKTRRFIGL